MTEIEKTETTPSKKNSLKKYLGRIIAAVVLLAIILIGLLVKRNNEYRKSVTQFMSIDQSFTVDYPRYWDVKMEWIWAIVASFVDQSDPAKNDQNYSYVNIAKWPTDFTNIEDAFVDTLEKYKQLFKNLEVVEQGDIKVDWVEGKKVVLNWSLGGSQRWYSIAMFMKDDITYVLTASSEIADSDTMKKQMNDLIKSWKFTNYEQPQQPVEQQPVEEIEMPVTGDVQVDELQVDNTGAEVNEQQPVEQVTE